LTAAAATPALVGSPTQVQMAFVYYGCMCALTSALRY